MTAAITCREFVEFLDDYVSASLPAERRAEFNKHLAMCPSCVAFMKTYTTSVQLAKAALQPSDEAVPADVPEGLIRAILAARNVQGS